MFSFGIILSELNKRTCVTCFKSVLLKDKDNYRNEELFIISCGFVEYHGLQHCFMYKYFINHYVISKMH